MENVDISTNNILAYSLYLGIITQATYAAPKGIKYAAAERVLETLLLAWNETCEYFQEVFEGIEGKKPKHLGLLFIYSPIAQLALGSITLSTILEDLAYDILQKKSEDLSEAELIVLEWKAFIIALACAHCDKVNIFEMIFKSGLIQNPSLMFLGYINSKMLEEREWLKVEDINSAKSVSKRLDRKLKLQKQYFAQIDKTGPIQLPILE